MKFGSKSFAGKLLRNGRVSQLITLNLCTKSVDLPDNCIAVKYVNGLAKFTIPLPSRSEKCGFSMKPITNNVGDLINMLKTEDKGIDRAAVFSNDGTRIASSCSIEALLDEPFTIHINSEVFNVQIPEKPQISFEDLSALGNVKTLVGQLYQALQVGEHFASQEKDLTHKLAKLKELIRPLEEKRRELGDLATQSTNMKTWVGLGLMSVQFGILARLTWWEYSWDIMEPVTFFVGYGTSIALYAYYCMTKTEYNYTDVENRRYLLTVHNSAKSKGLDINEYNDIKRQIAETEFDLKRLKDPLYLQMPPNFQKLLPPSKQVSRIKVENVDNNL